MAEASVAKRTATRSTRARRRVPAPADEPVEHERPRRDGVVGEWATGGDVPGRTRMGAPGIRRGLAGAGADDEI